MRFHPSTFAMPMLRPRIITIIIFTLLLPLTSATTTATEPCRFSFLDGDHLYNYTLSSPIRNFPHGILSEDGFYKVAVNETTLWFQLCDGMVFNHDPPVCADCWDCGGPNRCGTQCNALVANKVGGYHVCTTLGRGPKIDVDIIDKKNPHTGVIVKMSNSGPKFNCSLAVSVLCNLNGVQGPQAMERLGACDYIIPNLDFWVSLPRRTQSLCASLVRRFKGPSESYRSSYSPVNF
ncbi:uncharacterized protein [Phaseolus vulgaris]|uniref:uncharacterized protein isoform X2 n=1 Tax=Phaseolus vulgaris TaxID=3885 RepID=UPI0035CC95AB